jgi:Fic family protein
MTDTTSLFSELKTYKQKMSELRPLSNEMTDSYYNWCCITLTYTSNALEGNSLTYPETAAVIEKGIAIGGKILRDHIDILNHAKAFEYVHDTSQQSTAITTATVLDIHRLVLMSLDKVGRYRTVPVHIPRSPVTFPHARDVHGLMNEFSNWLRQPGEDNPCVIAAQAHHRLVSIHPFTDGNGRTARLLMNLILMRAGYPPTVIRPEDHAEYLKTLEKADVGDVVPYYAFMANIMERSFKEALTFLQS